MTRRSESLSATLRGSSVEELQHYFLCVTLGVSSLQPGTGNSRVWRDEQDSAAHEALAEEVQKKICVLFWALCGSLQVTSGEELVTL